MLQIFDGGGEKYLLTKDNGFLDELSVTNGKLYASQASIPPSAQRAGSGLAITHWFGRSIYESF